MYLCEGHRAVPIGSLCKQDLCPKCWEWGQRTPSIAHPSRGCLGCTAALPNVMALQGWPCPVADLRRQEYVCGLGIPAKRDNCRGFLSAPCCWPQPGLHGSSTSLSFQRCCFFPLSSLRRCDPDPKLHLPHFWGNQTCQAS